MNYEKNVNTLLLDGFGGIENLLDKNHPDYYIQQSLIDIEMGVKGYTPEECFAELKQMLIEEGLRQGYTLKEIDRMFKETEEDDDL